MDPRTAQRLLHKHLHDAKVVSWINENTSQRAFPFAAAATQFVLSEGTDRETINTLCYDLTALLGYVAAHLRHVDLTVQSKLTIKAIVQHSADVLEFEHKGMKVTDTLAATLAEQLSDWSEDGASADLAALFGEALTVVAQTLNCVNSSEAWATPHASLLEACEQAVEAPESDWQLAVMRALGDTTWGESFRVKAHSMLNPEQQKHCWHSFETSVRLLLKQKCSRCYAPGSIRYSCGEYAGRYCDEHWETAGFRPADDHVDYLDAGEYATEEEA